MTSEELYSYVPLQNISAIYNLKEDSFIKKYKIFIQEWIIKEKCLCVKELREDEILNCKHLKTIINKKFKKEKKELWNLSLQLIKGTLVAAI